MSPDELEEAHGFAKRNGFDALIPFRTNDRAEIIEAPESKGVGATCFCRGTGSVPQVIVLEPGETGVCRLCGAVFHRFTNNIGIGVRLPKINRN